MADSICNKSGFDQWVRVEAIGYGRGIWILWKESLQVEILKSHPQFIHLRIGRGDEKTWLISVVYGSPNASLRRSLWKDLHKGSLELNEAWLIMGDFNSIMAPGK